MPTFDVDVYRTVEESTTVTVAAANEAEARERALEEVDRTTMWFTDSVLDTRTENVEQQD